MNHGFKRGSNLLVGFRVIHFDCFCSCSCILRGSRNKIKFSPKTIPKKALWGEFEGLVISNLPAS
jgi:hypothetical protein